MPTYTNNTPQATQTIASTQPLILDNFAYLDTSIGTEHNFDITDPTKTYHKQASMPNRADPGALPAGTNGMYYVGAGLPKYFGAQVNFISLGTGGIMRSFSNNITVNAGATGAIVPAINGDFGGMIYVVRDDLKSIMSNFYQQGANKVIDPIYTNSSNTFVIWNGTVLSINNTSSNNHTYHYFGWFIPVV